MEYAFGFSIRKRRYLERFLGRAVRPLGWGSTPSSGDRVYVWGSKPLPEYLPKDIRICRVEDGFIRSVGLGAGLAKPASWVFDDIGIYYDPRSPSTLEQILSITHFSPEMKARAQQLRVRIVQSGLSKYNVDSDLRWGKSTDKPVLLVPGQVEDDASIRLGAVGVNRNLQLLREVRERNPSAYIVYKPHPDVVKGLREGGDAEARNFADEVVKTADIHQMLNDVDEVHVMTSLTGFEALLRGKKVTCYGQPFYSGWGLTRDVLPSARRQRTLDLDDLVCGSLILYPTYLHPKTMKITSVEEVVEALIEKRMHGASMQDNLKLLLAKLYTAFA